MNILNNAHCIFYITYYKYQFMQCRVCRLCNAGGAILARHGVVLLQEKGCCSCKSDITNHALKILERCNSCIQNAALKILKRCIVYTTNAAAFFV